MNCLKILAAVVTMTFFATGSFAQGTEVPFGGLKHDPKLPVEVSADQLKVDQTGGSATFIGNVIIGQGKMRLSAAKVFVEYGKENGKPTNKVSHVVASGGVTLVNGPEAAESKDADYDLEKGIIVMTGDVLLTQGPNALSSEKMTVYLESGTANMEGRVRSIFNPESSE